MSVKRQITLVDESGSVLGAQGIRGNAVVPGRFVRDDEGDA